MNVSRKVKLWLLVAASFVVAAVLLREAGFLRVQLYSATFVSELSTWKSYLSESPDTVKFFDRTDSSSSKTITDARGWHLGFSVRPEPTPPLEAALRKGLDEKFGGVRSKVIVLSAGLSGPHWTPLRKTGTCYYGLGWRDMDENDRSSRGLSGEIEFDAGGLLSTRDLQEMLVKTIVEQAARVDRGERP